LDDLKSTTRFDELFRDLEASPHIFTFSTVYDIGASDGVFSKALSDYLEPDTMYHLFEPHEYKSIEKKFSHNWHRVYLSDCEKEVDYFMHKEFVSGNSYYKEVTGIFDNIKPTKVSTTTLDLYVEQNNLMLPNIIKIDTQGSELDILKGATKCLENADLVILEVPILKYNEGAPNIIDIISYLLEHRFVPFKTLSDHYMYDSRYNYYLVQQDMAFIKMKGTSKLLYEL
jgi:FkbM family methyltransferase